MEELLKLIPGAEELVTWFGTWPSFHDAEILSLALDRSGPSTLRIHTRQMTGQLDDRGYFVLEKHVHVIFLVEEIFSLSLFDFNQQNVIFGLGLKGIEGGIELLLDPCHGLSGAIAARRLSIQFEPI